MVRLFLRELIEIRVGLLGLLRGEFRQGHAANEAMLGGGEVHQHRQGGLEYLLAEVIVVYVGGPVSGAGYLMVGRDAVLGHRNSQP